MSWSGVVRQAHRWIAATFMLIVAALVAAPLVDDPAEWLYYLPLAPLALLMASGVWLFALPYVRRRRETGRAAGE